jgi:hypothetical protein
MSNTERREYPIQKFQEEKKKERGRRFNEIERDIHRESQRQIERDAEIFRDRERR